MNKIKLFLIAMLCSIASGSAWAQAIGSTFKVDDFTFEILTKNTGNYTVSVTSFGTSRSDMDVEIPTEVKEPTEGLVYKVTQIKADSPASIKSLTIPEGIEKISYLPKTSIGSSLRVPSTVTDLPSYFLQLDFENFIVDSNNQAFYAEDGILFNKSSDTNKKELRAYPLANKTWIKTIEGNTTMVVPEGVTHIVTNAISSNYLFKVFHLPSTFVSMPTNMSEWNALSAYTVAASNPVYCTIDSVLCGKSTTGEPEALVSFPKMKKVLNGEYVVPDILKKVGTKAFDKCKNVSVLDLNKVENLASSVCTDGSITEVIIGANLPVYPAGTITGSKLNAYTVREGNLWLYSHDGALFRTINNRTNNYSDFNPVEGQTYTVGTDYWYKLVGMPGAKTGSYEMPKYTLVIGNKTLNNTVKITDITFNDDLEVLQDSAFFKNSSFKGTLDFEGTKVWKIGTMAFNYVNCKEIRLSKTLEYLNWASLSGGYSLEKITIHIDSLKQTGLNVLYGCNKLTKVNFEGTNTKLTSIDSGLLWGCPQVETVDLRGFKNLTKLTGNTFNGCKKLNNFILPKTVTTIGTKVFYGCTGMTNFTFEDGSALSEIGENTFENTGIVSLTIPDSVITIKKEAFRGCLALKDLNVSKNCKNIDPLAFQHCYNITNIEVEEGNPYYSSSDGILLSKDKTMLLIYPAGKTNEMFNMLPPTLTTIGTQAFYDIQALTSVVIPSKVTKIEPMAFWKCPNLKVVTMLCEKAIDPANIGDGTNKWAFTDADGNDNRKNIILYVREKVQPQFEAEEGGYKTYYSQFGTNTAAQGTVQKSFWNATETEEYINVSEYAYSLLSVKSTDYTYTIPETVTGPKVGTDGDTETLKVMLIGDYAFQEAPADGICEVILHNDVEYIGARAFLNDSIQPLDPKVPDGPKAATKSTIKRIFFVNGEPKSLATVRYKLGGGYGTENFDELTKTQRIFVKKSALEAYKEGLEAYKDQITYKIMATTEDEKNNSKYDFINMTSRFGTFSREFDVDLGEYYREYDKEPNLKAFATGSVNAGPGDNEKVDTIQGPSIQYHLSMKHIEYGSHTDGTCIPKNTGALLALMDNSSSTPSDFYYCIAEDESTTPYAEEDAENTLCSATVNKAFIPSNENYWVMQGGYFRQVKGDYSAKEEGNGIYLPAHKAYLKLKEEIIFNTGTPEGHQMMAVRLDNQEVTAIKDAADFNTDIDNAPVYYNLQGMRISKPEKGLYIMNGKKYVR